MNSGIRWLVTHVENPLVQAAGRNCYKIAHFANQIVGALEMTIEHRAAASQGNLVQSAPGIMFAPSQSVR